MSMDDVNRKLAEKGYTHPENNNSTYSVYKTYSENSSDVYVSSNQDVYQTINFEDNFQERMICPICKVKATYICDCEEYKDFTCKKGHVWYYLKGKLTIGDPHENE